MVTKRTAKPKKAAAADAGDRVKEMTIDLTKFPHHPNCPYREHGGTSCSWCIGHLACQEGIDAHQWNEGYMYAKVE